MIQLKMEYQNFFFSLLISLEQMNIFKITLNFRSIKVNGCDVEFINSPTWQHPISNLITTESDNALSSTVLSLVSKIEITAIMNELMTYFQVQLILTGVACIDPCPIVEWINQYLLNYIL